MPIDRRRVEELKGQTPLTERVVRGIDDLVRICRAATTAGELLALEPRLDRFDDRRHKAAMARSPGWGFKVGRVYKFDEELPALILLASAMEAARALPSDAPIDEQFWESAQGGVDAEDSGT